MMKLSFWQLGLCAAFIVPASGSHANTSAPLKIQEREFTNREYGFLPEAGATVKVNPPPISWMRDTRATSWALQIARDPSFKEPIVTVDDWPWMLYTHTEPFFRGEHFWRYRFSDESGRASNWSTPLSFTVPTTATRFARPSAEELRRRIPTEHPRMYTRPERLAALRETANEPSPLLSKLLQNAKQYAKRPPMEEPPPWSGGKWNVEEWRKHMSAAVSAGVRLRTLAFAWLMTEDEAFGEGAKKYLLEFASWDPQGTSGMRHNDEVGMPVLFSMARAYDWVYGYLSEAERNTIREALRARAEAAFDHMRHRPYEQLPFNSHFGRMWHWIGEAGLSLYGEVPEAEKWLDHAMMTFYGWYPFWGDSDGGWAEGIWYWSSYNSRVTTWLDLMQETLGIDAAQKPFYSNVADFPLFVAPPGNPVAGFGDFSERGVPGNSIANTVATFARLRDNSAWQWYAEAGGATGGTEPLSYLRSLKPTPQAEKPTDLPMLKVFQKSGIAAFHTDLTEPEDNLHVAFRCSEFGNISHSHSDQNAIVMAAYGEPLLVNTGRRDYYNSPFTKAWYWHTQSHNALLVDGKGQPRNREAAGSIVAHGEVSDHLAWAVGDASNAYGDSVKFYRRWVAFLPDRGAVVVDEIESTASEVSLMYHARAEFDVQKADTGPVFLVKKGNVHLRGTVMAVDATTSQTDEYPVPLHKGIEPHFDEWHLRIDIPLAKQLAHDQADQRRYIVTFLEVGKDAAVAGGNYAVTPRGDNLVITKTVADGAVPLELVLSLSEPKVVRSLMGAQEAQGR